MVRIILASASPRRQQLLNQIGVPFEVLASNIDEDIDSEISPYAWVKGISSKKAAAIAKDINEEAVIIAADTIVTDLGRILEKPADAEDAKRMLRSLQGRTHTVYTGMTLIFVDKDGKREENNYVSATDVTMSNLTDEEIDKYISTGECYDKAGAYAVQGLGSLFIEGVSGDYYTVVGLPLNLLHKALKEHGINLTDNWK